MIVDHIPFLSIRLTVAQLESLYLCNYIILVWADYHANRSRIGYWIFNALNNNNLQHGLHNDLYDAFPFRTGSTSLFTHRRIPLSSTHKFIRLYTCEGSSFQRIPIAVYRILRAMIIYNLIILIQPSHKILILVKCTGTSCVAYNPFYRDSSNLGFLLLKISIGMFTVRCTIFILLAVYDGTCHTICNLLCADHQDILDT